MLVASPGYLAAHGEPARPEALAGHDLIAFRPMTPTREWRFIDPRGGAALAVAVEPRFATNSGEAAIEHARQGGGITSALSYQVDAALKAGDLVEVLGAFGPPAVPIQAVFPTARLLSSTLRAFLSLAERAASEWCFGQRS